MNKLSAEGSRLPTRGVAEFSRMRKREPTAERVIRQAI